MNNFIKAALLVLGVFFGLFVLVGPLFASGFAWGFFAVTVVHSIIEDK